MFFHKKKELTNGNEEQVIETGSNFSNGNQTVTFAENTPVEQTQTVQTGTIYNPNPTPAQVNIVVSTDNNNSSNNNQQPKKKKWPVILTACLGIGIVGVLTGFAITSIALAFKSVSTSDKYETYITLTGKNRVQTERVLSNFLKDNVRKIKDYAFIGTKLYLSESKITPSLYNEEESNYSKIAGNGNSAIALWHIDSGSVSSLTKTDFSTGKYYIDLENCMEGDYLIFPLSNVPSSMNQVAPYSISSSTYINDVLYSLPNTETGIRKKITLKNNDKSPFTILSVSEAGVQTPKDHADLLITGVDKQFHSNVDNSVSVEAAKEVVGMFSSTKYNVKYVENIQEIYKYSANKVVSLSTIYDTNYTSIYNYASYKNIDGLDMNVSVIDSSLELAGYDALPEIREVTGYLDNAGQGYAGVEGNSILPKVTSLLGKESFLLPSSSSKDVIFEKISKILSN